MSRYDIKMKQAFGDFSDWTYTGNCDAQGGFCECGKQIIYRYFVNKGDETKVVGSTCIEHFKGNSALYATLKKADKDNQRNHKEREKNLKVIKLYFENVASGKADNDYESQCKKYVDNPNQYKFDYWYRVDLQNRLASFKP